MNNGENNLEAFNTIVKALQGLEGDVQQRTLQAVITFLNISISISGAGGRIEEKNSGDYVPKNETSFSVNRDISPKDFMREKMARTDVERVSCLAYYLTHYRDTQYFKTLEISSLNTEAAQPKFSNATYALENATKAGLLVQGERGTKQLSAAGELFVQKLPDREAAKDAIAGMRVRRKTKKANKSTLKDN